MVVKRETLVENLDKDRNFGRKSQFTEISEKG